MESEMIIENILSREELVDIVKSLLNELPRSEAMEIINSVIGV